MTRSRLLPFLFGVACVVVLLVVRALDPYAVRAVREISFDQMQRIQPREYGDYPVRIVDIDEASLAKLGQWPWPRNLLALLVTRLSELGAAAIMFDIVFPEPDRMSPKLIGLDDRVARIIGPEMANDLSERLPDNDAVFASILQSYPVVVGFGVLTGSDAVESDIPFKAKAGFAFSGADPLSAPPQMPAVTRNLPVLEAAAQGLGSISISPGDTIAVIRKIPLLWTNGEEFFPSLAVEGLRVAQGASTIIVKGAADTAGVIESIKVGSFEIPTTAQGEFWVHFSRDRSERYVSAADVLDLDTTESLRPRIAGQIVLVGTSATGLLDIRATALGENVPGVSIHAQALEQIISGEFLQRADWVQGLEILSFALIGTVMVAATIFSGPLLSFALGGGIAVMIAAIAWLAFSYYGLLVDPSFPLGGGMLVFLAMTSFRFLISDREKRQIRRAFGQYVAPSILEDIERNPDALSLGGAIRPVTVMFMDVRNFTPLSEKLAPVDLVTLLNRLLGALSAHVIEQSGTIDKYIGDSLMAFWNAPVDVPAHERYACIAALKMRQSLIDLNESGAFAVAGPAEDRPEVAIAIGLNTGEACVGNMGSEQRFDYSVIGDTVNISARVESACRHVHFDIMITGSTAAAVSDMALLPAGSLALKGKSERLSLNILVGDEALAATGDFAELRNRHESMLAAMAGDRAAFERALASCREIAPRVQAGLEAFYRRIPDRLEDFADRVREESSADHDDEEAGVTTLLAGRA